MLYRIWCSSKWYHSRSIWMGIFQPRKLNSVFLLTFFIRSQLKIRTVKMIENYVCCTEFHVLSNDTTLDQFEWEFSNLEFETILIDDFWLTILIDDFDWRFLIDDFDWRFLIDDFWLTILIDDFQLTILIDDFDWRFLIDDFDWRFLIDDFWLTILIDDFDWRFLIEFSNLESWTQYFYSLFSNDRSWRSELSKWLKIMYVVQNLMLFKMIPLSINLNGDFLT